MADPAGFSVRIVSVDSYVAKPAKRLDAPRSDTFGEPSQRAPVIRIFGATPAGQTVCMHIHRVFPYIYIPYDGSEPVDAYLHQFASSLDHALNFDAKSEVAGVNDATVSTPAPRHNNGPQQHVFKISIVKGIPFYGFYEHEVLYLKIYFYNPASIKRALKLLVDGAILRKSFQPYEAHIPYILQFFMDHNLQGMNFINIKAFQFRSRGQPEFHSERIKFRVAADGLHPLTPSATGIATTYHALSTKIFLPAEVSAMSNDLFRTTTCELEVDVLAEDILNREEIEVKIGVNPGLEAIWRDENQRRTARGLPALVKGPAESQERKQGRAAKSEIFLREKLRAKLNATPTSKETPVAKPEVDPDDNPDIESPSGNSMILGISSGDMLKEDDFQTSFVLDVHSPPASQDADVNQMAPVADAGADAEEMNESVSEQDESAETELADVLRELAEMADRDEIDLNDNESTDLFEMLRQDDLETAEMSGKADLSLLLKEGDRAGPYPDIVAPAVISPLAPPISIKKKLTPFGPVIIDSSEEEEEQVSAAKEPPLPPSRQPGKPTTEPQPLPVIASSSLKDNTKAVQPLRKFTSQLDSTFLDQTAKFQPALLEAMTTVAPVRASLSDSSTPGMTDLSPPSPYVFSTANSAAQTSLSSASPQLVASLIPASDTDCGGDPELPTETSARLQVPLSLSTPIALVVENVHEEAAPCDELGKPASVLLRPAAAFPTWRELERTRHLHGIRSHDNATVHYTGVDELLDDQNPGDDLECAAEEGDLPIQELVEFESRVVKCKSSVLYAGAASFVAGAEEDEEDDHILAPGPLDSFPGDDVRPEPTARQLRITWMREFCSEKDAPADPESRWSTTLTPALPFPDLSHLTRLHQRLAEGSSVSRRETLELERLGLLSQAMSKLSLPSLEQLKRLGKDTVNSAVKARVNPKFEALLGDKLGSIGKLPAVECRKGKGVADILHESENLLILSMELHADTLEVSADPHTHAVRFLAYTLMTDTGESQADGRTTCICVDTDCVADHRASQLDRERTRFPSWFARRQPIKSLNLVFVASEMDLFNLFISQVRSLDPDILAGYEIQLSSWGYFIERGVILGIDVLRLLSRLLKPTMHPSKKQMPKPVAAWEARKMSEIHIVGRIVLNLWRLMRKEVTLTIYSFENVVFHVLNLRLCRYSEATVTRFLSLPPCSIDRWRAFEYFILRSTFNVSLLTKLDLIRQTSEFSRLFGIQFYETLTRGSQFRVESLMLRLAKPFCLVPVSPTRPQLLQQVAPECVPLILEPTSCFYQDPVVVLDFQSLYPSMVIAYNYCFSTCLGRIDLLGTDDYFRFGCTAMKVPRSLLQKHLKHLNISPNGVAFVPSDVRRGILPQMLEEILTTRIMVKKAMADYKDDLILKKLLHARQLGLKLVANVTYGYTAASFSGRMPCVDISDSIVAKARETLQIAMKYINGHPRWNARVVYGDTDSLFVVLRGRSKLEAFRIGREMERVITAMNPKPVKLKFEKVYMPCILQTKKRYCGHMYESEEQREPVFDAKGIETVRRDTCQLVSKTLRQIILLLFSPNCDILSVKQFMQKTFSDVLTGDVPMHDFIFAKEYRGRESYKDGAKVPALEIAKKATGSDSRAEPRIGERVPYIIVYGDPDETLITLVRQPWEIFADNSLRPHGFYYCARQLIPVVNRVLLLLGLDATTWFHLVRDRLLWKSPRSAMQTLSSDLLYFRRFCLDVIELDRAEKISDPPGELEKSPRKRTICAVIQLAETERQAIHLRRICNSCMGSSGSTLECVSFDCPVIFRVHRSADLYSRLAALVDDVDGP
ncbi:DNA polymerase zeta catalytic subunit [Hypsibius exemplaris]|uniref:DNA polymerase n=1 Tax=Hypsibius exemplaris TaxID=2072580 RepID=A0A1W0WVQ0_HYPEX|nr:DNA polymerase zeta catalytic subunit [Hypsibius exemplaris]